MAASRPADWAQGRWVLGPTVLGWPRTSAACIRRWDPGCAPLLAWPEKTVALPCTTDPRTRYTTGGCSVTASVSQWVIRDVLTNEGQYVSLYKDSLPEEDPPPHLIAECLSFFLYVTIKYDRFFFPRASRSVMSFGARVWCRVDGSRPNTYLREKRKKWRKKKPERAGDGL